MNPARPLLLSALLAAGCAAESAPPAAPAAASTAAPTPDAEGFVQIRSEDVVWRSGASEKGAPTVVSWTTEGVLGLEGDRRGYLSTLRPYRNFTLRFDYRWPTAADLPESERAEANTGVLVYITGEHKIWPACLEVQGKWSEMGHIKSNSKDVTVTVRDDQAARQKARKPVGQWNAVEIVSKDGALISTLNGVTIAESDPTELREGSLGFQAERFDVEFRNLRIREE